MTRLSQKIRWLEHKLLGKFGIQYIERIAPGSMIIGDVRCLDIGEGPPVVLLHSLGFFGASWAPLIRTLGGMRIIAVDLPGYGLSGGVDYRSISIREHMVEALSRLLDELEIDRATFVGNSLGRMHALFLALDRPQCVCRRG